MQEVVKDNNYSSFTATLIDISVTLFACPAMDCCVYHARMQYYKAPLAGHKTQTGRYLIYHAVLLPSTNSK